MMKSGLAPFVANSTDREDSFCPKQFMVQGTRVSKKADLLLCGN